MKRVVRVFGSIGLELKGSLLDPGVAEWVLDSRKSPLDFRRWWDSVISHRGGEMYGFEAHFASNPGGAVVTLLTSALTHEHTVRVTSDLKRHHLLDHFQSVEMRVVSILAEMEWYGLKISSQLFEVYRNLAWDKLGELQATADRLCGGFLESGESVKFRNNKQLQKLFEDMDIIPPRDPWQHCKTKGGKTSRLP
jgi:DNA polymerase I-like protein with 3'-5' exonuclease and polymerase domains